MPTASTIPLILLLVFLWKATKGQILPAVLFTSVFTGASALNIGAMGIPCWLFTLVTFLAIKLAMAHRFRFTAGVNRLALHAVIAFVVYVVVTGLVYPMLFAGTVISRRGGLEPISWDIANLAQLCYLLAVTVLYFVTVSTSRDQLLQALDWYMRGCVTAGMIAIYQLLNAITHIPYPEAILYSNKVHTIYRAYKIAGIWRLNSTFNEASEMSTFMLVAMALLGWKMVTETIRPRYLCSFSLLLLCLLMTQSSTGYVALAILILTGGMLYTRYLLRGGGAISHAHFIVGIIMVLSLAAILPLSPNVGKAVQTAISSTILDKKNSQSYLERSNSDLAALETLSKTYYMGAGWGSTRASGLFYNMVANIGVPGFTLFLAFVGSLFLPLFRRHHGFATWKSQDPYERSMFAMAILLTAMFISGSELGDPVLWVLFGTATVGRRLLEESEEQKKYIDHPPGWQDDSQLTVPKRYLVARSSLTR